MKKLLIFLFLLFIVSGCGSDNTPKKEVQKLFSNYNNLSSDLLIQLDSVMESENLTEEQIVKYKEVLKRQYEDLKYKIYDKEKLNNVKFWDYKLNKMLDVNERINYTVDFSLTKLDGKWVLDELLEIDRQKLHGLYK